VNVESQVKNESGDQLPSQCRRSSWTRTETSREIFERCLGFGQRRDGNLQRERQLGGREILERRDAEPLRCLFNSHRQRQGCGCTEIKTGFRKAEFKGGAGTGGVYLNDKFVWLTGYSQRSSDEWAGLGEAYPDWMHDYNAALSAARMRITSAGCTSRRRPWMCAPATRRALWIVCPAGDKEGDPALDNRLSPEAAARQWEQRAEVMRDSMIYFRNDPSILFWEAGNNVVTTPHAANRGFAQAMGSKRRSRRGLPHVERRR
jgi:hypothetical protein